MKYLDNYLSILITNHQLPIDPKMRALVEPNLYLVVL